MDREIKIGPSRLFLDNKDLLWVESVGEIDDDAALATKQAGLELASLVEGKVDVFIDVNHAGKPSKGARKTWKELTEHEKFGKIAFWGLHPVARILASFVMGVSGNREMRFFKTKEAAFKWLGRQPVGCLP